MRISASVGVSMCLIIGLCIVQSACTVVDRIWKRGMLPEKLEIGWFYAEGHCTADLFTYQGAYAFGLTDETVAAIDREGLSFFQDINEPNKRAKNPGYFGGEWRPTPIPLDVKAGGVPRNIGCAEKHSWLWPNGIEQALNRPGSYYKTGGGRSVYIIPRLKLVVGDASDR